MPAAKKTKNRIVKISTSANINPEPLFILSINELNDAHPKTTARVMSITPSVFNITENVFFTLKYNRVKREKKNARYGWREVKVKLRWSGNLKN